MVKRHLNYPRNIQSFIPQGMFDCFESEAENCGHSKSSLLRCLVAEYLESRGYDLSQ